MSTFFLKVLYSEPGSLKPLCSVDCKIFPRRDAWFKTLHLSTRTKHIKCCRLPHRLLVELRTCQTLYVRIIYNFRLKTGKWNRDEIQVPYFLSIHGNHTCIVTASVLQVKFSGNTLQMFRLPHPNFWPGLCIGPYLNDNKTLQCSTLHSPDKWLPAFFRKENPNFISRETLAYKNEN